VTPAELADHWDQEARTANASAENTRSLSLYEREHERARTLGQCAMQLRLVIGASTRAGLGGS